MEGCCDFFWGRQLECCPWSRSEAESAWEAWRFGWLQSSSYNDTFGERERRRWRTAA
jgi:hypothetical protein